MTPHPYARIYILFFALAATYVASWGVTRVALMQALGPGAAGLLP
jgi:hypothetical protein